MIPLELLTDLDLVQKELDLAKKSFASKQAAFEEDNKKEIDLIKELKEKEETVKRLIYPIAKEYFLRTGEKKLAGGIGIREMTIIDYDPEEALRFAKEKDLFLTLDTKAFDAAAPKMNLSFVTILKDPKVTFPKEVKLDA